MAQTLQTPIRVGIFNTISEADEAVSELMTAGFSKEAITVVCSNEQKEAYFRQFEHQDPAGTFTPNAALTGSAIGAILAGLTVMVGAAATGGVGLLAAGGIAAWAGGVAGGLVGAMMSRGVEKELANFYDQAVAAGKILVAAEAHGPRHQEMLGKAERVFVNVGAEPIPLPEG